MSGLISGLMSCWLGDPVEEEGEANGAEIQWEGALGVSGGVGLPGTGECWKLEMTAPVPPGPDGVTWPPGPRGDMLGISVLICLCPLSPGPELGNMPGLEPGMLTRPGPGNVPPGPPVCWP